MASAPLRTRDGQSLGELERLADARNKADMIEIPLKQAKIDPAAGIIEKTSLEAETAAENARVTREVIRPTSHLHNSAMSYYL